MVGKNIDIMTAAELAEMEREWRRLLAPFDVPVDKANAIFNDLVRRYQEDGRYYHNFAHVRDVLEVVDSMAAYAENITAVRLAAWFHDVIYEMQAKDNEERSAHYAEQRMQALQLPTDLINRVKSLILATKTHQSPPGDIDCQILLDADLSTFAARCEQHNRYSQAIRQEYAFVPESDYRTARKKILLNFLQRERIFLTDQLFTRLEARARRNIRRELAKLG